MAGDTLLCLHSNKQFICRNIQMVRAKNMAMFATDIHCDGMSAAGYNTKDCIHIRAVLTELCRPEFKIYFFNKQINYDITV